MGTPISNYDNTIKLQDLTIEQKELIEKEIFNRIKPKVGTWAAKVSRINVPKPFRTAKFRTVTYRLPPEINTLVLEEGVVPDPVNGVIVSERTIETKPLGAWKQYTDESAYYSFDEIVRENVDDLTNQIKGSEDNDIAALYTKGTQVYEAATGLTREIFASVRIALRKMAQSDDKQVYCVMTPEDASSVRLRYNKEGANLFQDLPANSDSVLEGKLHKFEGIIIEEDDNPALYKADGKRLAIFYVKDTRGRYPVSGANIDGIRFIHNPLGSGKTEDPLEQKGTMGVKCDAYGIMITAEECLIKVEITPAESDLDTVDVGYTYVDDKFKDIKGTLKANKNIDGTAAKVESSPKLMVVTATTTDLKVSGTKTATLTVKDIAGSTVSGFTATSNKTSVATVSGSTVTAVAAGEAVITIKKAGYGDAAILFKVVA